MSVRQYRDGPLRVGALVLVLLMAAAAAPVLDDIIGFFADAPYVQYLPFVVERGVGHAALDRNAPSPAPVRL